MNPDNPDEKFEKLLEFLKRSRGFDFSGYKRASLIRRVRKRMEQVCIDDFTEYVDFLEVHPEEFAALFNMILINVTSFFRDENVWQELRDQLIPQMVRERSGQSLRIWVAGCATGQEAYSLAILLCELLGEEAFQAGVKIYATDVDEEAITEARVAAYAEAAVANLSPEQKDRFFVSVGSKFTFRPDLRRAVIFGRHDLIDDPPISNVDLLFCRNTLMYLNAETQSKIVNKFHYALRNDGYLVLGKAEMLLGHTKLFVPVEVKLRIFRKVPKARTKDWEGLLGHLNERDGGGGDELQPEVRSLSFDASTLPQIVVDEHGTLVLSNQRARETFNILPADIGKPFQDVDISYRPLELRTLITQAHKTGRSVEVSKVARHLPDGAVQYFDVEVIPLLNGDSGVGTNITFSDVTIYHTLQDELQRATQEMETANEELQSAHEELETSNEELQSTNEELETTNEELQSTNEELETMNEELQSTNEELETTNNELRSITIELNSANSFLESILGSLRSAVIVVDKQYRVITWTQHCQDLWGLREAEVLGQSLLSLDCGLPVHELKEPIRTFLAEKEQFTEFTMRAMSRRGKSITCRIRITPLDHSAKGTKGVVITIDEIEPTTPLANTPPNSP